jgi:hypothetical protein
VRSGELADANFSGLRQASELLIPNFGIFLEFRHDLLPATGVFPQIHFQPGSSKGLFAGITRKAGKALVHFQEVASRDQTDSNSVGAGAERGKKHLLGTAQGVFGST